MKRSKTFGNGIVLGIGVGWLTILALVVAVSLIRSSLSNLESIDREMIREFAQIKPGMTSEQIVELMGEEGEKKMQFHLSQRPGYEFEYEVAGRIGAAYFVSWQTGIDLTMTVAFDENDRVIYKAKGNS